MNASKSINIKIAIILTAKINRIILKETFADWFNDPQLTHYEY